MPASLGLVHDYALHVSSVGMIIRVANDKAFYKQSLVLYLLTLGLAGLS
jgi:hypothetical protein